MSIKSILIPFYSREDTVALKTALSLVKQYGAHLEALNVTPDLHKTLVAYSGGFFSPSDCPDQGIGDLQSECKRKMDDARSLFTKIADEMKVDVADADEIPDYPSAKFISREGNPAREFAIRARLADLIVINRAFGKKDKSYGLVETALFRTGRPVLLMPQTRPERPLQEKVLIAWNGSFEASRAVHLALPFIKGAKVRIFTGVESEAPPLPARDLVVYLKQQGIAADVVTPELMNETREEALKKAIDDFSAGLLVMGAFSREGRLRETLLGSFTAEVLENATVPVLMAN